MTKFTRQHYKQIAEMVAVSATKEELIDMLCVYFKTDNERFNEQKFRAYIQKVQDD